MYKVYNDGIIIHDPSSDDPARLIYGATVTQQANMADAFEFTIYPSNPEAANIHKLASTVEVYQDGALLFRGRPIQTKEGWNGQQTITCEGGLAFLNDTIIRPYDYTGSVRGYLEMLINQHNLEVPAAKEFTVRTVTVTDPNNTIVRSNTDYTGTMKEIQEKLVKNLGGYLIPEYSGGTWYLDYLATPNGTTSQKITLAKNLLDFLREQNAENIATALIPLGAVDESTWKRITIKSVNNNKDYIVDQTALAQYGYIFATETWDDVTVPANLLRKAQARLADYTRLIPTIQLTAVDLSIADQSIEPIRVLDTVTVEDDQHTASGQYLVQQRTYNLSDPAADKVTFGGAAPTMSGATQKTAATLEELPARTLQTASDRARAILDSATDGAIQILYNADGVAYELRINNSQDPSTATKWWRYNANGWGYTDDGGQTYTVAATMDGTLYATLIKAGVLSSPNGVFSVNMATGAATLNSLTSNNATITGGSLKVTGQDNDTKISVSSTGWATRMASDAFVLFDMVKGYPIIRMSPTTGQAGGGGNIVVYGANRAVFAGIYPDLGLGFYDYESLDEVGFYPKNKFLTHLADVDTQAGTQISLATATWKAAASITLQANRTYLLIGMVSFAANSSGYRRLLFSTTAESSTPVNQFSNVVVSPASGIATRPNAVMIYRPASNTTVYLNVYQNSGAALNITGYIQAMTIEG